MINYQYTTVYIASLIFCGILVIIFSTKMNSDIGSIYEIRYFKLICADVMLGVVSQSLYKWGILGSSYVWLGNAIDLIWTDWFVFLCFKLGQARVARTADIRLPRWVNHILTIPIVIITFLNLISCKTSWIFYINEFGNYMRGDKYWLQVAICYGYSILIVIMLVISIHTHKQMRRELETMLIFALVPSAGGVLQVLFSTAPYMTYTVTLSIMCYFIDSQSMSINTDALTGLLDRHRSDELLKERSRHVDRRPFFLFMIDVDNFKKINDTYGHLQGDAALKLISGTLLELQNEMSFLIPCRFGGDEFMLIVDSKSEFLPEEIVDMISQAIDEKAISTLGFPVHLTFGYAFSGSGEKSIHGIISEADKMLYMNKEQRRA